MGYSLIAMLLGAAQVWPLSQPEVDRWRGSPPAVESAPPCLLRQRVLVTALARADQGKTAEALELLRAHPKGNDPIAVAIRFHAARLGLAAGESTTAGLRALFTGPKGPLVRWGITRQQEAGALMRLAQQLEKEGHLKEATSIRQLVAVEYPRWTPPNELDQRARLARARNLARDMDYDSARTGLEQLIAESTGQQKRDRQRELGHLIGDKMRTDYEQVADLFAALADGPDGTIDDRFYQAYAVGKLDDDLAAELYRQILKDFPVHPQAHRAAFFVAWTEFQMERFDQAVVALTGFVRAYPQSDFVAAARWYRGLALFRTDQLAPARTDFAWVAGQRGTRDKGQYWIARAQFLAGDSAAAERIWQGLAKRQPFTYYGMLARARLQGSGSVPLYRDGPEPPPVLLGEAAAAQRIEALAVPTKQLVHEALAAHQLGEIDLAQALAEYLGQKQLASSRHLALKTWLANELSLAHWLVKSPAAKKCRGALGQDPARVEVATCWRTAFPTPFAQRIAETRDRVPAELFWSIMRQESLFRPTARSHADALGLMQIIEQVGRPVIEARGQVFAPYALYSPSVNLSVFAEVVGGRSLRLGGHVPLLLASYNASEEKAVQWLSENRGLPFDLFVEEIPFAETREYIKRVTAHLARYRTLCGEHDLPLHRRVGLPHPDKIAGTVYADVLASQARP